MKNIVSTFFVASCFALIASCTYNKEELVVEPVQVNPQTPIPSPSAPAITYTSHVKSYIDNNCVGCHGSSGGVSLQTYAQVKAQADAGRILARAINGSGGGPMPPSGLMPQATLDTLQLWLDQGTLQ